MIYYLMHAGTPLAVINIDAAGHLTDVGRDLPEPDRMPLRYKNLKNGLSRW